jgi:RimJ/RimL family protein N-acetyltransferase
VRIRRAQEQAPTFLPADDPMNLKSTILENRFVRLEPIGEGHRDGLRTACAADPETWTALYPYSMLGDAFDVTWARMMRDVGAGRTLAFAVEVAGAVVGMTTYSGISATDKAVEIGGTYYRPEARGGPVNPAAKRLLLAHAFDCGAGRVQFKVDAVNARSRAAVLKLGAVQEGLLRHDRITWTGRVRDTVFFSILAEEWPAARERLDARLAAFS